VIFIALFKDLITKFEIIIRTFVIDFTFEINFTLKLNFTLEANYFGYNGYKVVFMDSIMLINLHFFFMLLLSNVSFSYFCNE